MAEGIKKWLGVLIGSVIGVAAILFLMNSVNWVYGILIGLLCGVVAIVYVVFSGMRKLLGKGENSADIAYTNFKFTWSKGIMSIVITFLFWVVIGLLFVVMNLMYVPASYLFAWIFRIHNFENLFSMGNVFLFLIEVVIVYVIWSLIQKKNNSKLHE